MHIRQFPLFLLLFFSLTLGGCGASSVKLKWEDKTAPDTYKLAVLDNGTQLALAYDVSNVARDKDGNVIGAVSLPRDGVRHILSLGNQFALYGVSGNDIWRIIIDSNLQVVSDTTLYTATGTLSLLELQHFGAAATLYWKDSGRFTYFIEGQPGVGQLSAAQSVARRAIDPANHYWYVDATSPAPELVELDLTSATELSRSPLPEEFASVLQLQVNQGFVVGTRRNTTTDFLELLVLNRATGTVSLFASQGGFGSFALNLMGQDGQGNIYYNYLASFAHSGFSIGLHVRVISNTQINAWDYKLGTTAIDGYANIVPLPSGIRMLYQASYVTGITNPLHRKIYSNYIELAANGVAVRRFALKPVEEDEWLPYGGITQTASGYHARHHGADAAGNVYLYGTFEALAPVDRYYLAGMY